MRIMDKNKEIESHFLKRQVPKPRLECKLTEGSLSQIYRNNGSLWVEGGRSWVSSENLGNG